MYPYPPSVVCVDFYPHPLGVGGFLAQVLYPNGYVVSIVNDLPPCGGDEFEVEVLHCDGFVWPEARTEQSSRDVNAILAEVYAWPRYRPNQEVA